MRIDTDNNSTCGKRKRNTDQHTARSQTTTVHGRMSATSPGGTSPSKGNAAKVRRGLNASLNKGTTAKNSLHADGSTLPETTSQESEWEKQAEEQDQKRLEEERLKRNELEEIRRAEADRRKARDKERLAKEEEKRREAQEKQKLLDSLEKPMAEMLHRLGCYEQLAMLLGQNQIFSLKGLLAVPRSQLPQILVSKQKQVAAFKTYDLDGSGTIDASELKLALVDLGIESSSTETEEILKKYVDGDEDELDFKSFTKLMSDLGTSDLEALDRVVLAARRSVALDNINNLQLREDEEWEATAAAKSMAEKEAKALQMRRSEQGYGVMGGKKAAEAEEGEALADQIARKWEVEDEKPPAGPLRNELIIVVNRWYDYLATVPSLGEFLARSTAGYEVLRKKNRLGVEDEPKASDDEAANRLAQLNAIASSAEGSRKDHASSTAISGDAGTYGPTWKHTIAWALWMLTDKSHRSSRKQIEKHLKHAQEHVWRALYPGLELLSVADWRIYWQRVKTNFDGFFSTRGIDKWKQVAAADARAQAIREGKSSAEQDAAASKAEKLVSAMLHQGPRRRRAPPLPQQKHPGPAPDQPAVSNNPIKTLSTASTLPHGKATLPLSKRITASRAAMMEHRRQEIDASVGPPEVAIVIAAAYEQVPTESPTRFARYDASPSPIRFATTQSRYMDALTRPVSHDGALQPTQLPFGDRSPRPTPVPQLPPPSPSRRRQSKTPRSARSPSRSASTGSFGGSSFGSTLGSRSHRGRSNRKSVLTV